ncbi:zinc ribbon domain-containing protein [Lactococcus garvieae]
MKLTKKQVVVGGVVALLIAGVGAGVVHNQNVQAEKAKQVQQEKDKKQEIENTKKVNEGLIKEAKSALLTAQKSPNTNNLELAKKAISHVKDDKTAKQLTKELDGIKNRVKLETEAKKAVAEYQKDATNADKLKKAQTAVSKLTSDYSKTLKAKLTKDISTSKAQADKAKKAEEAKKSAQTAKAVDNSNQTAKSNNSEANQTQADSQAVTDPAPTDNRGVSNNNTYQPAPQTPEAPVGGGNTGSGNASNPNPPSTGGGNTVTPPTGGGNSGGNGNTGGNNGGGTVTPPPAATFTGWVKNKEGQIVWTQGGFKSLDEAYSAAANWLNSNATSGGWSAGSY